MLFGVKLNKKGNTDMKKVLTMKNYRVMKNHMKYICAFLMMVGISTSVWGTNSFDVSSITIDDLDWGTSTDYLTAYVGYDNGSIVTSNDDGVWFQAYFDASLVGKTIYVAEEGHTDGFGFWDNLNGYIAYLSSAGEYAITFQYLITEPRTSHTATIKFFYYDGEDPSADASGRVIVLSIPVTINMTGGYVISTAVDPSATGTMTAKVNGSARTRVMSNERLDLVATPADGYQFLGWTTDGDEDTDWEIDNDMSASTYAYIHANQTITANFEVACTSRSITMSDFSKDFGSADFVPTHTVSAGSGTKTWTSSNTDVATIVDGKVHIVAAGTTTIGLSVAADDPYCAVSKNCTMTVNALVPTVTAFTGTSTTPTSITFTNAQVSNKGGAAITAYGYIYSTSASTTETLKLGESGVSTATVASADIAASTNFASKTVSELTTGTTYYVRAYATNSAGTGYSAIQSVKTIAYTDYKFSCADWTLTGPSGDIVFITSAASKTVRSQEAFHVSGNGLPHNTALTFSIFPLSSKFVIKKADGTIPQTDEYGVVDADVYVFYTPDAGDTSDGLDEFTSLTVSVTGEPRTATIDTKRVIGRHLPADFVIAVKRNNKWLALPATMNDLTNPSPVEIAVDNIDNPSAAYTAASNIYNLYGQNSGSGGKLYTNGETVKLGMKNNSNKPLFGSATGTSTVKGDGTATVTNNIGSQYWWTLSQTATSITNPQDAQYSITCSNNTAPFVLKENAGNPQWGFFTTGSVGAIRLIPATDIPFTEAYFVEWGQHGGVIEVDATGIDATSVVAHLNGASSSAITLVQTKASDAKNKSSKYNYTVNFGGSIDFAAATSNGALLRLEWKKDATVKAMTSLVVPKIVASNITIDKANYPLKSYWNTEVHVLPGKTVTVDPSAYDGSNVTIKELNIYPGATVVASTGTLIATTVVLRNGWSRAGTKTYDVARLYITPFTATLQATNMYADWYIDYDQYYPIAVPFPVATSSISYKNSNSAASAGVKLRYYDGASRASNIQAGVAEGANWKEYSPLPATLEPSKGYAMTARRPTGKAFSIIRMPLTIPSASWTALGEQGEVSGTHKDQVSVTGWGIGTTTPWYAVGWNFIGNPYMSTFNGDNEGISGKLQYQNGGSIRYATIPDIDFMNYDQVNIAEANLKPASGFFVQANNAEAQNITFSSSQIVAPSVALRYTATAEVLTEQDAYIRLSSETAHDQMGLIIADEFTAEYETNADLVKILGEANTLKTYMSYNNMDMAYLAINQELAQEWIPVVVKIPETGQYTFSLTNSSEVEQLAGVYLIDYNTNSTITNLIDDNYIFTANAGTYTNRFAINAIVGERQTPTAIDALDIGSDPDRPIKFIFHDKVFILYHGIIYDSTGKRVKEVRL